MKKISNNKIDRIEKTHNFTLPGLYRKLLIEMGFGEFGVDKSKDIYHPSEIRELYESFFDDPEELFNIYFPFGCDNETQELWIIDVKQEKAASIWHETVPEDWEDESWLTYENWVINFLPDNL